MNQTLVRAYGAIAARLAAIAVYEDFELSNRLGRELVLGYVEQFTDFSADDRHSIEDLWNEVWKGLNGYMLADINMKMRGS